MNCNMFSLVASKLTANRSLVEIDELQNVCSSGEEINCKMFSLVANRCTGKCFSGGENVNCKMFSLVANW